MATKKNMLGAYSVSSKSKSNTYKKNISKTSVKTPASGDKMRSQPVSATKVTAPVKSGGLVALPKITDSKKTTSKSPAKLSNMKSKVSATKVTAPTNVGLVPLPGIKSSQKVKVTPTKKKTTSAIKPYIGSKRKSIKSKKNIGRYYS